MEETLKQLGLSPVEIKIYLFLLKEGSSLAGNISKNLQVNRSNCYDALERLIAKGSISYVIKENRKYFKANEPESLFTLINDRKAKIEAETEKLNTELKKRIHELQNIKKEKTEQETGVYETKAGIKVLLDDMIKAKKPILIVGVSNEISKIIEYYLPRFHNQRIKNKIPLKIILNAKLKSSRGKELELMKYTKVKYLQEKYASISTSNVYDEKVAIMIYSDIPLGILIKNKFVADSYRKQFELLWKIAKK